nr:uncharacterized protein LOC123278382 [Equus asinus]XP_044607085.1 uncharacterized protein LOC123278382 [Equus asinus]
MPFSGLCLVIACPGRAFSYPGQSWSRRSPTAVGCSTFPWSCLFLSFEGTCAHPHLWVDRNWRDTDGELSWGRSSVLEDSEVCVHTTFRTRSLASPGGRGKLDSLRNGQKEDKARGGEQEKEGPRRVRSAPSPRGRGGNGEPLNLSPASPRPRTGLRRRLHRGRGTPAPARVAAPGSVQSTRPPPLTSSAAQLGWSWGPERLSPTAHRRRAPRRHATLGPGLPSAPGMGKVGAAGGSRPG